MTLHQIASGNPLLWLDTFEFERASHSITDQVNEHLSRKVYRWNIAEGIVETNSGRVVEESNGMPTQPIEFLLNKSEDCILQVFDYGEYINEIDVWRPLLNAINTFKSKYQSFVVVAPLVEINESINRYFTVVDFEMPSTEELVEKVKSLASEWNVSNDYSDEEMLELAKSAKGLTISEMENALALSFAKTARFTNDFIREQRQQMIKKSGTLDIFHSKEGFEAIVGLDRMKTFAKKMVESKKGKGILVVGHPGTAKSFFAKCLGKETNRPTIVLETGRLMGSLVGQTEKLTRQAFQIINAQPGCIVFIDEIEKALSGTNSQTNDSSIRQGGQILQWLNDEKEDIYVIATANDVTKLPPEFLRAGRWDALFFADLPTEEETNQLLEHFCHKFEIDRGETPIDVANWTGAEIESLCRIASSIEIPLEEAKAYVQPISKVANEKIVRLREWAQTRTIDASNVVKKQTNQNQTRKAVHL